MSAIADLHGDHQEAYRLAQQAYEAAQKSGNYALIGGANERLGSTLCGIGRYDDAVGYLSTALKQSLVSKKVSFQLSALAPFTLMVAQRGENERAAELLGLVLGHRLQTAWLKQHPKLTELQQYLQAELGEDAYNAAWERGKALGLETVARELLAEYESDTSQS
jgi:hypothetical protein